jgi:poly-gamma-glutamate synthesis protein (capsule biosynthesis protein)
MGDIFFGRYINDWSNASPLGVQYPFQQLQTGFNRDNYDAWIANFECPSVAGLNISSAQMDATLSFNCDPKYLPEVAKYWDAVSLGNNHTGNQGDDGFKQTQANLAANKIQYFGAADPSDTANDCNVIALNIQAKLSNNSVKPYKIPFGFCGYDGVYSIPTDAEISEISTYAKVLPTFAMPHMGVEYTAAPNSYQVSTYHKMIDAGAEMVIGNHPHWTQTTEDYKGKLIVYSMGNFIFDQQSDAEVTRSALIDVAVTVQNVAVLEKWSAIADQCAGDFAKCSELATAQNLPKLQLSYQFDVRGGDSSNKLTKPASAATLDALKSRLGWDATMTALGQ